MIKYHFITFATDNYLKYATDLANSAINNANFDYIKIFTEKDIDKFFLHKNKHIFDCKRGYGYWIWKSYIINKYLSIIDNNDDYICYCDSMYLFSGKIKIQEITNTYKRDIIITHNKPNQNKYIEKNFTKGDAFFLLNALDDKYCNTYQAWAGFMILKKTDFTLKLIEEWLLYMQDIRIIDDYHMNNYHSNYIGFIENRHDQSVFSLIAKKNNIEFIDFPNNFLIDLRSNIS